MKIQHWLRYWLLLSMATFFSESLEAQTAWTPQAKVYHGYLNNDRQTWESGVADLTAKYTQTKDAATLLALTNATYGLLGLYLAQKSDKVEPTIKTIEGYLGKLLAASPNAAEALAIQGGLYGIKIGMNKAFAPYYGPKSLAALEAAIAGKNAQSPYGWVERGNAKFHSPALFGGDTKQAAAAFSKAVALFEAQGLTQQNWLYLHSLAWLGKSHEANGEYEKAYQTYQKLLAVAPNFLWAKNELLPQVLKKRMQ